MRRGAVLLVALLAHTTTAMAHDPSSTYRWMGDDDAPSGRDATLTQAVSSVWTADLQAVLTMAPEVLGDGMTVAITPREARALAELPAGLFADGNVYEISIDAEAAVTGQLDLVLPHDATTVLVSADGESWSVVPTATFSPGHASVPLRGGGLFLAATDHAVDAGRPGSGALRAVVLVGAPAVLLLLLTLARRRRGREVLEPVSP
jgi:hypothetical protein